MLNKKKLLKILITDVSVFTIGYQDGDEGDFIRVYKVLQIQILWCFRMNYKEVIYEDL